MHSEAHIIVHWSLVTIRELEIAAFSLFAPTVYNYYTAFYQFWLSVVVVRRGGGCMPGPGLYIRIFPRLSAYVQTAE